MTNDERNPKPECRKTLSRAFAGFVIRTSSFLRISSFVIRILQLRIMESPLPLVPMHWDHEPREVPRRTESADKSDALQTLRAVRRRPAVAKRLECVRLQRRFPKAGCNSMAGSLHGKPQVVRNDSENSGNRPLKSYLEEKSSHR